MSCGSILKKTNLVPYAQIAHEVFMNPKLSLKAKGLLGWLLSKPDNWDFSVEGIGSQCKDGRDSIRSTIKELIKEGYLVIEQQKEKGKFSDSIWYISHHSNNFSAAWNPVCGEARSGEPDTSNNKEEKINKEKEKPPTPLKGDSVSDPLFFGKFVKIKKEEYEDLKSKYGKYVDEIIEEINDYLSSTGKKPYKDYAATIRSWLRRRGINAITQNKLNTVRIDPALLKIRSTENKNKDLMAYANKKGMFSNKRCRWDGHFIINLDNKKDVEYKTPTLSFMEIVKRIFEWNDLNIHEFIKEEEDDFNGR